MRCAIALLVACSSPPSARAPHEQIPNRGVEPTLAVLHSFPGVDLLESRNSEIHDHGGPAARIGDLVLNFEVNDHRAHTIEAKQLELLQRHCREDKWRDRKRLLITEHLAFGESQVAQGDASVTIAAGGPRRYFVRVHFQSVEVYQSCDHFAFALDLIVDRVRGQFEIPLDVTREESEPDT